MKDKLRKALPSIVYLIVALLFFIQSFSIRQSTSSVFGMVTPKTFPRVIIGLLAICAVANLVNDLKNPEPAKKTIHLPGKFLLSCALFVGSALIVKKVGFVITGSLFLPLLLLLLDDQKMTLKRTLFLVIIGVVIAVGAVYGFRYGLKVRLPMYPRF